MNANTINYYRYIGKSNGHRLVYHSLDVGAFVMAYGERWPALIERICQSSPSIGLKHLCALAACHDVGKFALCFQGINSAHYKEVFGPLSPPRYYDEVRHYRLGRALAARILPSGVRVSSQALNAVFLHHGVPVTYDVALAAINFGPETLDDARAFTSEVFQLLGMEPSFTFRPDSKTTWALAGLMVFCDWLASGHAPPKLDEIPLYQYWQEILPLAHSVIDSLVITPHTPSREEGMKYLFPKILFPTPLQETVSHMPIGKGPHLIVIEEPTGAGKTEAGTVLAHRIMKHTNGKRIFYGLPTAAMANSLYRRLAAAYARFFEPTDTKPSLILAHATSRMSDDFRRSLRWQPDPDWDAVCALWYADDRRKCLLADVGVGTIDQALMGAMPKRFQSLRLLGLAGNILIVDEVHAYDSYTFGLVCALLNFHAAMGGSAVLLSATLPIFMRQQLVEAFWSGISSLLAPKVTEKDKYPLLTHLRPEEEPTKVLIELSGLPPSSGREVTIRFSHNKQEIEDFLLDTAASGKCACWIVNTIDDVISAHEKLIARSIERGKEVTVMLFHSRFALRDRQRIEADVEKYFGAKSTSSLRTNKILVATQVVEQSLDLDFDEMVIDLCPIDIVIQRMGRLRRHIRNAKGNRRRGASAVDQRGTPCLVIHSPPIDDMPRKNWFSSAFKGASGVYPDHGRLWKTAHILQDKKVINVPSDVRALIEEVYDIELKEKLPDSGIREVTLDAEVEAMCKRSLASQAVLVCHNGYSYDALLGGVWDWHDSPPTRMGKDKRVDVYLSICDGDNISPIYSDGDWPWEMSRVQISAKKVSAWLETGKPKQIKADVFEKAVSSLPGKGAGALLMILSSDGYECWTIKGKWQHVFKYSPLLGATISKEMI